MTNTIARFIYYSFQEHPELESNNSYAINLYKSQFQEIKLSRLKLFPQSNGISIYEDETNTPIRIRSNKEYFLTLKEPIKQEFLAGNRNLERYSYFKLNVSNYDGNNQNIQVNLDLDSGQKFKESIVKTEWDNHERYISYMISGIKQKCIELDIANLNFVITDLEYNLYTSSHTSLYAVKHFIDKYIEPKLINKASA